MIFLDPN
jgi:hypothetical protein